MKQTMNTLINVKKWNDLGNTVSFGVDPNQYWGDIYSQKESEFSKNFNYREEL